MAIPLKIKTIEWSNFMSYGDYQTSLELNSLGPVLIVGQKDGQKDESNGVGKTTITTAIIWCLFGRTPRRAAPGDKVINFYTKGECYVKIITIDDWVITRTRKLNGHDDLLVHKDGEDVTLSTTKHAQLLLKKLFNLDYDIFISSMFFGQRTESFLEMSDMKRKAALERLLGLNRLNVWGDVAKEKRIVAELEQQKIKTIIESKQWAVNTVQTQIDNATQLERTFESDRCNKIESIKSESETLSSIEFDHNKFEELKTEFNIYNDNKNKLLDINKRLGQAQDMCVQLKSDIDQQSKLVVQYKNRLMLLGSIDVDVIEIAHKNADLAEQNKLVLQDNINKLALEKRKLEQDLRQLIDSINGWNNKAGTNCPSCQQPVTKGHTDNICKPYLDQGKLLKSKIKAISDDLIIITNEFNRIKIERPTTTLVAAIRDKQETDIINANIKELNDKIVIKKEQYNKLCKIVNAYGVQSSKLGLIVDSSDIQTRYDAMQIEFNEFNNRLVLIGQLNSRLVEEQSRENPYRGIINSLSIELNNVKNELNTHLSNVAQLDINIKSYDYIRHSYHDRNKIKMFILSGLIPYLNQRIEYYLNAFECDLILKFTSTLSIETSRWDYDFHSGGQQKRIDIAIMFALYDLYISMYGQQCNVMVLDEVDGALDSHGVRMFVDIITNDFSGDRPDKPDTILVISHKNDMVDQFPNQIIVSQDAQEYSHILKT